MSGRSSRAWLTALRPWGWAPDSVAALAPLSRQLPAGALSPAAHWNEARRQLYAKTWSARWLADILGELRAEEGDWLCDAAVVGSGCATQEEVEQALAEGFAGGWRRAVLKADFGAAGGQQALAEGPALPDHQQGWLRHALRDAGAVVVEPWLDRVLDLSAQYDVDEDGSVRFLGLTRFLTDPGGRFQGVFVHNWVAGLDVDSRRFLYGDGRDGRRLQRFYGTLGERLRARLPASFCGPLGIDALVYRDEMDGLRLKPVVEANPRYTMGRVGLALGRRVRAATTALWRVLRIQEVTAGFTDAAAWATHQRTERPLEMTADGTQIARGVLFTNEPETARSFIGMLAVGESIDDL